MSRRHRLLLMSSDPETVDSVTTALDSNGRLSTDDVCRDLPSLVGRLERRPANGVLVDIDAHPTRMLADLEPIIARFADTRFILLSHDQCAELLFEAMQIGARHVLGKQVLLSELPSVVQRLIPNGSAQAGTGPAAITVLSAGGGCGATTVAINLAYELQLLSASSSLLVDLDYAYGSIAGYLGVEATYGIADVLANPSRVDGQLIRSSAVAYSDGLSVLVSPAAIGGVPPALPDLASLGDVLAACRRSHGCTIIDAPRVTPDVAAMLARSSRLTLIVAQLTVKDLRFANLLMSGLIENGITGGGLLIVINRYRRRFSMVSLAEAKSALREAELFPIRNDYSSVVRGLNYGQPLALAAGRAGVRKDFRKLAARVLDSTACTQGPSSR